MLANKVVSKDGKLDIRVIGVLHALTFLAAFAWLLHETRGFHAKLFIPILFLLIATDAAHAIYFNTFYAEPASYIFCIFLLAESIGLCARGTSTPRLARWCLWAVLFVLAKPMNAPLGLLLGAYAIRLGWRSKLAWAGPVAILAAAVFMIVTAPMPMRDVNAYDLVFLAVLPESKTPAADAVTLGIDPAFAVLSGTGAWGANSAFSELKLRGIIGKQVTIFTIMRFYLARPARMWRRIRRELQVAILLRPPLGNFDRSSGQAAGSMSGAFTLWSDFHEHVLARVVKILFLLLPVPAVVAIVRRVYTGTNRLAEECFGLLTLRCMTSFLAVTFSSPWETIKHMLIFNVLLDASMICAGVFAWSAIRNTYRSKGGLRRQAAMAFPADAHRRVC